MKLVGEALDQVRRSEQKTQPILRNSRILWLKNRVNLSQNEETRFTPLSEMNLKTARAYRMKEALKKVWDCPDIETANILFNDWYFWATHSRLEPFTKLAKSLKKHKRIAKNPKIFLMLNLVLITSERYFRSSIENR